MYQRDRTRNDGEMDPRDLPDHRGRSARGGNAPDYDGSAPQYDGAAMDYGEELPPHNDSKNLWSQRAPTDAYPGEDEGAPPGYVSSARSARPADRFLEDPSADFDDPLPAKPSRVRTLGFFLLMAIIGTSAGALWFYFDLDLARYIPGFSSNAKADRANEMLIQLVDEQTKVTRSVTTMQAAQDALQKGIAAREQELQRLLVETQALRTDMNALRTGIADSALRSHSGQAAKSAPTAAKKTKGERKSAPPPEQPQNESAPGSPAPSQ